MKTTKKITLDFSDHPELVRTLRLYSARTGESQKEVVIQALESFFAHKIESQLLLKAAEQSFAEWDNEDDEIYNHF